VRPSATHPGSCGEEDPETNYTRRQRSSDADYQQAYREWVESLPPEERQQLAAMGLEKPLMADTAGSGYHDAADSSRCSVLPEDFEQGLEEESDPETAGPGREDVLHLVRRLVGELLSKDNVRLSVECLALATGISYLGDSMTEIARRYGVTRAAVSKRCVEFTDALNLNPSRAMRSPEARQSYRRRRIHELNQQNLLP
jgi:hypothetical protein